MKMENLCRELLQKCAIIQENCAKIVPVFYSESLIKNDNDEEQLSVLTEFGYKDIKTIYFRHA